MANVRIKDIATEATDGSARTGSYLAIDSVANGTEKITLANLFKSPTITGNLTLGGNHVFSPTEWHLRSNTSDGSDNAQGHIGAGGGTSSQQDRGATIIFSGNEHANTGRLRMIAGNVAGAIADVFVGGAARLKVDAPSTAGQTALFVYDVDNATLERVTVGATDSGGAGFKVLRIPN